MGVWRRKGVGRRGLSKRSHGLGLGAHRHCCIGGSGSAASPTRRLNPVISLTQPTLQEAAPGGQPADGRRCGHGGGHCVLPSGHHPAAHADEGADVQQPGKQPLRCVGRLPTQAGRGGGSCIQTCASCCQLGQRHQHRHGSTPPPPALLANLPCLPTRPACSSTPLPRSGAPRGRAASTVAGPPTL